MKSKFQRFRDVQRLVRIQCSWKATILCRIIQGDGEPILVRVRIHWGGFGYAALQIEERFWNGSNFEIGIQNEDVVDCAHERHHTEKINKKVRWRSKFGNTEDAVLNQKIYQLFDLIKFNIAKVLILKNNAEKTHETFSMVNLNTSISQTLFQLHIFPMPPVWVCQIWTGFPQRWILLCDFQPFSSLINFETWLFLIPQAGKFEAIHNLKQKDVITFF